MPIDRSIREALDLKRLSLPATPPVAEVRVEDYTDSSGEPALRVLVVLEEDADVENLKGDAVRALKSAIHDSLRNHGVSGFPYIFLAKPSELADADDEG